MERSKIQEDSRRSIDEVLGYLWFLENDFAHRKKDIERELSLCSEAHPGYGSYLRRESEYYKRQLNAEYKKAGEMIRRSLPEKMVVSGEVHAGNEGDGERIALEETTLLLCAVDFSEVAHEETVRCDPILVFFDGERQYYGAYSELEWREVSCEEIG